MLVSRSLAVAILIVAATSAQARTHKVVNSFPNPHGTTYATGLAFMRGVLWAGASSGSTIHRVDAYTGAAISTLSGPSINARGLTHDGATLWVASWNDNTVYRCIDGNGQVISSFPAFTPPAQHPDGITWDGTNLLVSDEANQIHWFTPTGMALRSVTVPASGAFNPRGLAWDGTHVWAGYQATGRLRRHDPATGAVVLDIPSPAGNFQQGLAWGDWHLWCTGGTNSSIHQVDVGAPFLEFVGTMAFPNSVRFRLTDAQGQVGDVTVVLLSATGTAGFPVGGVTVPLTLDALTQLGLSVLPVFSALVDAAGVAQTPLFAVPPMQPGITFWAAAVTLRSGAITAVTDPIRFQSQ